MSDAGTSVRPLSGKPGRGQIVRHRGRDDHEGCIYVNSIEAAISSTADHPPSSLIKIARRSSSIIAATVRRARSPALGASLHRVCRGLWQAAPDHRKTFSLLW